MITSIRLKVMLTPLELDAMIGKNLKRIRLSRGLGQEEFAKKVNITKQRLSAYENAKEGLGKDVMARICTEFNVTPVEFYIQEDTPIPSTPLQLKLLDVAKQAESANAAHIAEELAEYGIHRLDKIKTAQKAACKSTGIRAKAG